MIVVDASVLAVALGDDGEDGSRCRAELRASDGISAPDLVDVETVSVLRQRWLAGTLTARRFSAAVDDLEALDVDHYPTLQLMRRVYELRANLTAYDAAYVALADLLGCDLVTADRKLARAPGTRCRVRVVD